MYNISLGSCNVCFERRIGWLARRPGDQETIYWIALYTHTYGAHRHISTAHSAYLLASFAIDCGAANRYDHPRLIQGV